MKTSTYLRQNSSYFYLIGLLSFLLASCGSYQNTSYYDNDGVYGKPTNTYAQTNTTSTNNQYKDYFKSLQDADQPTEIFTDVDNYGNYAINDSTQTATVAYPAWGSASTETSVVVYNDPSWYWGIGFGWGYPYYGYGWGYPWYGWGYYPGWGYPGWGYPGCGYGYYANYNYSYGRRGSAAYYGSRGYASRSSSYAGRNYVGREYAGRSYSGSNLSSRSYAGRSSNYSTNGRSYSDFRRSSSVNGRTYSSPSFTDRRSTTQGRSSGYDYSNRSSAGATNRSYTPNSSSSRTYSPSPSRSSNSSGASMRSGGGGSYGGGGGGRSYGGGGGGGRR
ncbi:hypothetical protein [Flavobacterium denitrificans]|uniref:hypothetical protein n=1 Tax=Flavobacterium denitrificans TaxID=281361 RepID=UPI0003FAE9C6|nr:hypothetical protein [Flavobacterium denitrificans]